MAGWYAAFASIRITTTKILKRCPKIITDSSIKMYTYLEMAMRSE
jgi:hypothetical protein